MWIYTLKKKAVHIGRVWLSGVKHALSLIRPAFLSFAFSLPSLQLLGLHVFCFSSYLDGIYSVVGKARDHLGLQGRAKHGPDLSNAYTWKLYPQAGKWMGNRKP